MNPSIKNSNFQKIKNKNKNSNFLNKQSPTV